MLHSIAEWYDLKAGVPVVSPRGSPTVLHRHLTSPVPQGDYTRHMTNTFALLVSLVLLLSLTLSRGVAARAEVRV